MLIYGAYGSNLSRNQMRLRCPRSKPLEGTILKDWRLVFKGVADIEESMGEKVLLGLYKITPNCEASLDLYEEYPKIYIKKKISLSINKKKIQVMFYVMKNTFKYGVPSQKYYNTIYKGYKDWGFDKSKLIKAGIHSINHNSFKVYKSKNWRNNNFINIKYLRD